MYYEHILQYSSVTFVFHISNRRQKPELTLDRNFEIPDIADRSKLMP